MVHDIKRSAWRLSAFAALVFAFATPGLGCTAPTDSAELTRQLILQINDERARQNLPGFQASAILSEVARQHACDNANHNRLSHIGSDGSSPGARVLRIGYNFHHVTENVALGYTTPNQVLRAWLSSSSHRRNILDPRTIELGLAIAVGRDGRLHWVMNGGTR